MLDRLPSDATSPGQSPSPGGDSSPAHSAAAPAGKPARPIPLSPAPGEFALIVPDESDGWGDVWRNLPSWLASTVIHLVLVLLLAMVTTLSGSGDALFPILITSGGDSGGDVEPAMLDSDVLDASAALELPTSEPVEFAPLAEPAFLPLMPDVGGADLVAAASATVAGDGSLDAEIRRSGLEMRRSAGMRQWLLQAEGGTPESEAAVHRALEWLARHQQKDGSWTFQHDRHLGCRGKCDHAGYTDSPIAATGLALLPFLGNGQTQSQGKYKENVARGVRYLVKTIKRDGNQGSLWDPAGMMYGHGLASIALCEAYAMSHERQLRRQAQSVVNFIVAAQDPSGGGWRYHPQMPGDTSVVGWQLMALKSAQMADLAVPDETFLKTTAFLNQVQGDGGATYGYQTPESFRPATTAIGLLCRMYLGWNHTSQPLTRGVEQLSNLGPSIDNTDMRNNLYYNYYATQVLHHFGGSRWQQWNEVLREYLVKTQSREGHADGSWYFDGADQGSGAGGRLYCTAMSAMILEVYYRHMPLYGEQSVAP